MQDTPYFTREPEERAMEYLFLVIFEKYYCAIKRSDCITPPSMQQTTQWIDFSEKHKVSNTESLKSCWNFIVVVWINYGNVPSYFLALYVVSPWNIHVMTYRKAKWVYIYVE